MTTVTYEGRKYGVMPTKRDARVNLNGIFNALCVTKLGNSIWYYSQ